jgi:hypothetical protein
MYQINSINEPFIDYILKEQQEFIMVDNGESTDTDGYNESLFKEEYTSQLFGDIYPVKVVSHNLRLNEESYDGSEVDRYISYKSISRRSD